MSTLLSLLLLSPPLLWQFPERGSLVQGAIKEALKEQPGHLLDEASLEKHLKELSWPKHLGCLDDSSRCANTKSMVRAALGLSGVMKVSQKGRQVTLQLLPLKGKTQRWTGKGVSPEEAARAAVGAYLGQGRLILKLKPKGAHAELKGVALEGPGPWSLAPGHHALRVSAKGHQTLETQVEIIAQKNSLLSLELKRSEGLLELNLKPPKARVLIDDLPISKPGEPLPLEPGSYTLRFEAKGYEPHEHKVVIKHGTRLALSIALVPALPAWRKALSKPHPDTKAFPGYLRTGLSYSSLGLGDLEAEKGRGEDRVSLSQQEESISLLGLELGIGWRWKEFWLIEPLLLRFQGGGAQVDAELKDDIPATMDGLSQTQLHLGRMGIRYPAWKLVPYALAGIVLSFQDFELEPSNGEPLSMEHTEFHLGFELGVRYHHDEHWFASAAFDLDLWFGARSLSTFILGGGYALEVPAWL